MLINDQRKYEGALMVVEVVVAVVRHHCSRCRYVSDSKTMVVERGISLEELHVREYPPEHWLYPSHWNRRREQGQRKSRGILASEYQRMYHRHLCRISVIIAESSLPVVHWDAEPGVD